MDVDGPHTTIEAPVLESGHDVRHRTGIVDVDVHPVPRSPDEIRERMAMDWPLAAASLGSPSTCGSSCGTEYRYTGR